MAEAKTTKKDRYVIERDMPGIMEYLTKYVGNDPYIERRRYGGFRMHEGRKYLVFDLEVSFFAGNSNVLSYREISLDGYMVKNDTPLEG